MMVEDVSEYVRELSMDIFANFMHRRFMVAHIVQKAFIFTIILGAFIFVKITTISWSLTICVFMS